MRIRFATLIALSLALILSTTIFFRSPNFDQDYLQYLQIFDDVVDAHDSITPGIIEPSFEIIINLASLLYFEVGALLLVAGAISLCIKFYVASRYGNTALTIFFILYASSYFLIHELNQTRVAIATALIYASLLFNEKSRFINIITPIASATFHYSSLLLTPFLLIRRGVYIIYSAIFIIAITFALRYFNDVDAIGSFLPDSLWNSDRIRGYVTELILGGEARLNLLNTGNIFCLANLLLLRLLNELFSLDIYRNRIFIINERMIISSMFFYYILSDAPVLATRIAELLRILLPLTSAIIFSKLITINKNGLIASITSIYIIIFGNIMLYGVAVKPLDQLILQPLGLSRSL